MNPFTRWLLDDGTSIHPNSRTTHTYVIGQPGTGKSRALESWALQDILSGQGVAVIDPHGDLFHNLVSRLAALPEIADRVVIIDPCQRKWVVSFNPLEALNGSSPERVALFLTDVVTKIWSLNVTNAPRMIWLLTNSFLALSCLGLTLLDLPRFLLDRAFRESLLPRLTHERVRDYFRYEYPTSESAIHQWTTPILNKIGGLIFDPDVRLMVAGRSALNFREVLDRRLVLLVHLPKGILGEGTSALLGAFIVAHIQKAALSRADTRKRVPYFLYLDEFQHYTTDNIKDILSESRKFGLSLTLAHQYLDQLSVDLRSAVLNTTGTICSFRVGYHDAYQLVREMFPRPDYLVGSLNPQAPHIGHLPLLTFDPPPSSGGWEGLAQGIANLPPRAFWMRQRWSRRPEKLRTLDVLDPQWTQVLEARTHALIQASGMRYGKLKRELEREIAERQFQPTGSTPSPSGQGPDLPLWGA